MDFVSIRIITDDVARLAGFYERATGVQAAWPSENFAELITGSATLAIASTRTVPLFAPGAARPADNNTVIIEFLVDDVDGVHQNLAGFVEDFVNEPAAMPGATGRSCSVTPTATSSTSSPRRRCKRLIPITVRARVAMQPAPYPPARLLALADRDAGRPDRACCLIGESA